MKTVYAHKKKVIIKIQLLFVELEDKGAGKKCDSLMRCKRHYKNVVDVYVGRGSARRRQRKCGRERWRQRGWKLSCDDRSDIDIRERGGGEVVNETHKK